MDAEQREKIKELIKFAEKLGHIKFGYYKDEYIEHCCDIGYNKEYIKQIIENRYFSVPETYPEEYEIDEDIMFLTYNPNYWFSGNEEKEQFWTFSDEKSFIIWYTIEDLMDIIGPEQKEFEF